jgi:pilus assembly protein CpaD
LANIRLRTWAAAGAIALAGALAGCAYPTDPFDAPLPHERWDITVRETRSVVEVPVYAHSFALSYGDIGELRSLAGEYLAAGHGPIVIALPVGNDNEEAAIVMDALSRDVLYEQGIAYRDIQGAAYDAAGMTDAPLVVMVNRFVAEGPDCHERWDNYARTNDGGNTLNFGCALRANLAAMVTDPADLLGPRAATPPDAARRSAVLARYRSGQTTITQRGESEGVAVSDAVD